MFSVFLTIFSSLIVYLELSIALVHMNIVRQRIRNNFRQSLVSKDTRRATRRFLPYKQRRFWTRPAERARGGTTLLTKLLSPEEWRENFRMSADCTECLLTVHVSMRKAILSNCATDKTL